MKLKCLIIGLSLIFAFGTVWAGGETEEKAEKGKVSLDFVCHGNPTNQEMFKAWIEGFNAKNPDIHVNYFPFPEGGWAKVRAIFAGYTATDITRANDDDVYDLAIMKKIIQLDPLIDKFLNRKDYFGATFQALSVNSKSYSANVGFGPNVFHYNVKMTKDAGARMPGDWESTWEWDEFVETLAKLTVDKDGDGRPEIYGAGWEESVVTPFLYSNGTNPLPAGVTKADFVQPKLIEIFQKFSDLSAKQHYATPAEEIDNRTMLFNSDKLAMTWSTEAIGPDIRPELEWDVAPIPEPKHRPVYPTSLDHDAPLAKDPLGAVWKKLATHELGQELINGTKTSKEFLEFIQEQMEKRIKELERGQ